MADLELSVLSLEYVKVPVEATVNGAVFNPTSDVVKMAFVALGVNPQAGDWKAAVWETQAPGTANVIYLAKCLVGTGGTIALPVGTYVVWVQVTDNPEVPIKLSGTLKIF